MMTIELAQAVRRATVTKEAFVAMADRLRHRCLSAFSSQFKPGSFSMQWITVVKEWNV